MRFVYKPAKALLALPILLSGCATITHDANQSVQLETYSKDNQLVSGVKCVAQNDRGQWIATAPGAVSVHRSGQDLMINCDKDGEETGRATVVSRANGGMFGNIVAGGGIGAIIDHNKGTAYSYPVWLRIIMGEHRIFDRKDEQENKPSTGVAVSEPAASTKTVSAPVATQP